MDTKSFLKALLFLGTIGLNADKIKIVITYPNGSRVTTWVDPDSDVKVLYDWEETFKYMSQGYFLHFTYHGLILEVGRTFNAYGILPRGRISSENSNVVGVYIRHGKERTRVQVSSEDNIGNLLQQLGLYNYTLYTTEGTPLLPANTFGFFYKSIFPGDILYAKEKKVQKRVTSIDGPHKQTSRLTLQLSNIPKMHLPSNSKSVRSHILSKITGKPNGADKPNLNNLWIPNLDIFDRNFDRGKTKK